MLVITSGLYDFDDLLLFLRALCGPRCRARFNRKMGPAHAYIFVSLPSRGVQCCADLVALTIYCCSLAMYVCSSNQASAIGAISFGLVWFYFVLI
jgi:hypothetical protein